MRANGGRVARLRQLFFCLALSGCAAMQGHGPVSPKILAELESKALTRAEFDQRLVNRSSPARGRVMVGFEMEEGATPIVKARLEGKETSMVFDTGASATVLHAAAAARAGVRLLESKAGAVAMQGIVGQENARIGLLSQLELGGWRLEGQPCLVRVHENRVHLIRDAALEHNLLGLDVLRRYCTSVTLDYPKRQIMLSFRSNYQPAVGRHIARAPFVIRHGVPFITLTSGGKSWQAVLDTGSFNGVEINQQVAEMLGVENQGTPVQGIVLVAVGGTMSSDKAGLRTVALKELRLLGERWENAQVDISPGPPRVGSFFLKDYRVTLDFSKQCVWLEW